MSDLIFEMRMRKMKKKSLTIFIFTGLVINDGIAVDLNFSCKHNFYAVRGKFHDFVVGDSINSF